MKYVKWLPAVILVLLGLFCLILSASIHPR